MGKITQLLEASLSKPPQHSRDINRLFQKALPRERRHLIHHTITAILLKANFHEPSRQELYEAGLWLRNNGFRYANHNSRGGYWVPERFNEMPPSFPTYSIPLISRTVTSILKELKIQKPTQKQIHEAGRWLRGKGFEQDTSGYKVPARIVTGRRSG